MYANTMNVNKISENKLEKKSVDKAFQWQTCVRYVADQIPKIPYAFCINKLRYKQELFDFQHQRKNSSQQSYDILNSHTRYYMHTMHCHIHTYSVLYVCNTTLVGTCSCQHTRKRKSRGK